MTAPSPLVERVADALQDMPGYASTFRLRSDAEDAARTAIAACHAEELVEALRLAMPLIDDGVAYAGSFYPVNEYDKARADRDRVSALLDRVDGKVVGMAASNELNDGASK